MKRILIAPAVLLGVIASTVVAQIPNIPAGTVTPQLTVRTRNAELKSAIRVCVKPGFPKSAAHRNAHGTFVIEINVVTGFVNAVRVLRSTGDHDLDETTEQALQRWKFQPNTVYKVTVPVEFHSSGKVTVGG